MSHLSFISRLELSTRRSARNKERFVQSSLQRLTSRLVTSLRFSWISTRYFVVYNKKKFNEVAMLNFHRSKVRCKHSKNQSAACCNALWHRLLFVRYCRTRETVTGRVVSTIPLHRKSTVVGSVIRGVVITCAPVRVKWSELILTSLGARPEGASLSIPIIACRVRGHRVKPCAHKPSLDRTLPRRGRESIQSLDTKSCWFDRN